MHVTDSTFSTTWCSRTGSRSIFCVHVYTTLALDQSINFYRVTSADMELSSHSIALNCNKHTHLGGIHHLMAKNSLYTTFCVSAVTIRSLSIGR